MSSLRQRVQHCITIVEKIAAGLQQPKKFNEFALADEFELVAGLCTNHCVPPAIRCELINIDNILRNLAKRAATEKRINEAARDLTISTDRLKQILNIDRNPVFDCPENLLPNVPPIIPVGGFSGVQISHQADARPTTKPSTHSGEGQAKCIAALTKHHRYADGGSLTPEPIGNNELARLAHVGTGTAKRFFDKWFGGHATYCGICRRSTSKLVDTIKAMNGEFVPSSEPNYGAAPPAENERD